ncbi:N-acetylmuramic acid 6-phosphate etherase [Marinoscillum furvescens]|uniref:N-acetylmuramic acid 6-phosphate etherase n=1 Tax=Marinoscillum furvescens DSM 4134 TaxID=1122208 RepID=A0A3D9L1Q3_MARFU|nr:N-acetylmuramic acid 6-phosphate etherase [Marinoscillum furvescens]RED97519.1 N-acetylmuramic acid 6-phosphate etherase [Marinoscillum furvescens DSM 4134]
MNKIPDTEQTSRYDHIEQMSTNEILTAINQEDATVALSVQKVIPQIEMFIQQALSRMQTGGRLFYIGSGTSGRLGVVDASECPPTFGVSDDVIIALIAGGDGAIRKAVEHAEDAETAAWSDLSAFHPTDKDVVLGIAASGTTPYVIGGVKAASEAGLLTGCIACSENSPLGEVVNCKIEVPVGPEFITGSTRMKSGTAQKMILNMISTTLMVKLGRIKGNKMVDMQLTNKKLHDRGVRMIVNASGLEADEAARLLDNHGSVRAAIDAVSK